MSMQDKKHVTFTKHRGGSSNLDSVVQIAIKDYELNRFGVVFVYSNGLYQYSSYAIFWNRGKKAPLNRLLFHGSPAQLTGTDWMFMRR